jgi:hypothetical protein
MRTRQLAWRRLTAWLVDWLCILILPAVLVPIGLPVHSAGVDVPGWVLNLGAFLILIVPVTCWLTILTYAVLLAWLWSILLPRTLYDVLSGTQVVSAPAR